MTDNKETTTVQQADINLDELLGTPGAENIMVPADKEEKPSIFSRKEVDLSFLDKPEDEDDSNTQADTKADAAKKTPEQSVKEGAAALEELMGGQDDEEFETTTKKGGRPSGIVELTNKLIEKGLIVPFEGDEDISKYSLKDFEELFEANTQEKASKLKEDVSAEFFDSLPEELQVAAHYVANGGNDLKSLFRSLAAVEEIRELDADDENGQEQIVRSYLHATNFGTADEIEEEIEGWKDRDELGNKAKKFKPKLDAMQEQVVQQRLAQQEKLRHQQHAQAQAYMENVYNVLSPGELNGLKVDKKVQSMLYTGLVQPNYPSVSGRPTNMLGHLLEKYQYVEPRHDLIAEALWLLADPDGYKAKVREVAVKDTVAKTVRQLKTEQASKNVSSVADDNDEPRRTSPQKLQRAQNSFFKR